MKTWGAVYTVSQKTPRYYLLNNSDKNEAILIIFGTQKPGEIPLISGVACRKGLSFFIT